MPGDSGHFLLHPEFREGDLESKGTQERFKIILVFLIQIIFRPYETLR